MWGVAWAKATQASSNSARARVPCMAVKVLGKRNEKRGAESEHALRSADRATAEAKASSAEAVGGGGGRWGEHKKETRV